MYPDNLKYTKEHEWIKIEGETGTVGITKHAVESLGDIVFVDLPKLGKEFNQFAEFGVVESVKSVSSLYLPLSGEIIEVNQKVQRQPELINNDPYGEGWLVKIKIKSIEESTNLLTKEEYLKFLENNK